MSNTEQRLREATPVEKISRALNLFHEYVKDHAEGSTRNHHRDIFGRAVLALSALAAPETGDGREGTSVVDALGEPRVRYVRVTLDGCHMVTTPAEAATFIAEAKDNGDDSAYTTTDVFLSEREVEDLPEFDGF